MTEVSKVCRAVWGYGLTSSLGTRPCAFGPPNSRGLPVPTGPDVRPLLENVLTMRKLKLRTLPGFIHVVPSSCVAFSRGASKLLGIFLIATQSVLGAVWCTLYTLCLTRFNSLHEVGGVSPLLL